MALLHRTAEGGPRVETRLLIAYLLIAILVAAGVFFARRALRKRQEHRQMLRGRRYHRKKA